jgi:thymidylate synthase (FAD)
MGNIIIQKETTIDPISLIGREAGVCWGADINNEEKNYKRGMDCLAAGHGRTWEYPQVYMVLDGYSARVIRELYTHIAGGPTRLQASTRYINYQKGFPYVTAPMIEQNEEAKAIYDNAMQEITVAMQKLEALNIPREDVAMLLPLGMESKVVLRTNLRNLIDMSHQRLCTRAYWEFRQLMRDLMKALSEYSEEWNYLVDNYFVPKCEVCGFCSEKKSCGRKPAK